MNTNLSSLLFLLILFPVLSFSQPLTGASLLKKSMEYHDPENKWDKAELSLKLVETRPDAKDRHTDIYFNLSESHFQLNQNRDNNAIMREVKGNTCNHSLNGNSDLDETTVKKHRLDCERSQLLRDYYIYLWGLPMKLTDKGTIIDEKIETVDFQGQTCYKMKVTYSPEVGDDIWYFYFSTSNYALIAYQFFHIEADNDGEYITLEGEEEIEGFRLPKKRNWYYNKDDKYLGSDILQEEK